MSVISQPSQLRKPRPRVDIGQHIYNVKVTDSLILELSKYSFLTSALSDFPTPDTFVAQTLSVLGFLLRILKKNISYSFLEVLCFLIMLNQREKKTSVHNVIEGEKLSETPGISML